MKTTTTTTANRYTLTACAAGLLIADALTGTTCTTTAPAAIVEKVATSKAAQDPAWLACDVAGFAERRALRNVIPAQVVDNGRTFRPVAQPDLFARL